MTSPTTVNEAQADLNAALATLYSTFEAIATDPDVIASSGDLITELSVAIPSIVHSIEDLIECGTALAAEIA
jgi:hypothetical protein